MTTVTNGLYGWKAVDIVPLSCVPDKQINLATMKRASGSVATIVNVETVTKYGVIYSPFSDFNKVLIKRKVRATEKAIRAQHEEAMRDLDILVQEAINFYTGTPNL